MRGSERFLSNHCRSLFISRFSYTHPREVSSLKGCKVVFLSKPGFFDVGSFTLFFMTGGLKFPRARHYSRIIKGSGRARFDLDIISVELFDLSFALYFWWRCQYAYLPTMDMADPRADGFYKATGLTSTDKSWSSYYMITLILESIPELDIVVGRLFSSVRLFVSRTVVRLYWSTVNSNPVSHLSLLRIAGFPAHT